LLGSRPGVAGALGSWLGGDSRPERVGALGLWSSRDKIAARLGVRGLPTVSTVIPAVDSVSTGAGRALSIEGSLANADVAFREIIDPG
jgi:hypothetical protein